MHPVLTVIILAVAFGILSFYIGIAVVMGIIGLCILGVVFLVWYVIVKFKAIKRRVFKWQSKHCKK